MMKSFFKKLAFVMALAMVVSLAAPAATTASAAEEMKIAYQNGATITELNLTEARSSEDLKAVGAPSNWKELGMTWTSSNPAVATVDNSGVVTAVAAGTADVMVICGDFTATIAVNCFANAEAYDVTIGTADERSITEKTLKVGEKFDFAFFGVKDYGRDKVNNAPRYFCEWDSTDTAVATVDKNGLVKAVAPGKAKITLIVWNLATGTKHNVTPTWVTVAADATPTPVPATMEVAQKSEDTAKLTFNNKDVTKEALEAGLKAYYFIGDTKVEHPVFIKEVKDNVATIYSYAPYTEGWTYTYEFADMEASFEAYIGEVASIVPSFKCKELKINNKAYTNYNTQITYKLYNDKGVDITTSALAGVGTVEVSLVGAEYDGSYTLDTFNQTIYFTQAGKVATVKVDYFTGEVDATGNRVVGATAILPIASEKEPTYTMKSVASASTTWNTTTLSTDDAYAATKPSLKVLFVSTENKYVWNTDNGNRHYGHFSYKSTKDSVVSVDANGQLTANAAGNANILVYYDYDLLDTVEGNVVAIVPITVIGHRVVTTVANGVEASRGNVIATFQDDARDAVAVDDFGNKFNTVKFKITVKDQTGRAINPEYYANIVCNNKSLPSAVNNGVTKNLVNYLQMNGQTLGTEPVSINVVNGEVILTFTAPQGTFDIDYISGGYSGYTYSFTVNVDGKLTSFSITVKSPAYAYAVNNNGTPDVLTDDIKSTTGIVHQGYELAAKANYVDLAVKAGWSAQTAELAFYKTSNGVPYMGEALLNKADNLVRVKNAYYYEVTRLVRGGILTTNTDPSKEQVYLDATGYIEFPLSTSDHYWANPKAPFTNLGVTSLPTAVDAASHVNKTYNGVDNYSVTIYKATQAGTNGALQIVAQQTVNVVDTQTKIACSDKLNNYYDVNALLMSGKTPSIEDLVKRSFEFTYGNVVFDEPDDYIDFFDTMDVEIAVDYKVNNSSNVANFNDNEVYYINQVYIYVPIDEYYTGAPTYAQFIVPVNDYVVIER